MEFRKTQLPKAAYPEYPPIKRSLELFERAKDLIPAQTQTLAKGPGQHVFGTMPIFAKRAEGSRLWDVDGNEFLDFQMAIGPLSLGYNYSRINAAVSAQLQDGITFSLPHELEVLVAEKVRQVVPHAEQVRFSKTGADATSAAVRVARAFTKREKVLCCGYHGWHDWYVSVTDRNLGIPAETKELTHTIAYNDLDHLERSMGEDTACLIIEPMVFQEPDREYLQGIREICDRKGVLLIFDEMWTGFRWSLGGAQEWFGVRSDLATFSKAVANGMPISLLTGRAEVMRLFDKDVFFFTTFGGEALSLAAALATISELEEKSVPAYLGALGIRLQDAFQKLTRDLEMPFVKCMGHPARTMVAFQDQGSITGLAMKSFVQQELGRRGILWGGFHNLSFAHHQTEIDYLLQCYQEIFREMREHIIKNDLESQVRGRLLEPVFRRTNNFNTKPRNS